MKSATLITLGAIATVPFIEKTSQSGIVKTPGQIPSFAHATSNEDVDAISAADIDQIKAVLQNKKLLRRAAMIFRDPCPDCTIL